MAKLRLKPFVPKEYEEQVEVVLWALGREAIRTGTGWLPAIPPRCKDPRVKWLFATLNGIRLTPGLARKAKLAGNNPGVPDLILPVHTETYCGLYIELKRQVGGRPTPEQNKWIEHLSAQGYKAVVCHGADAAIKVIADYLNMTEG